MPTTVREISKISDQSRRSLPDQLLSSVPICAQSCLEQYISKSFDCPEADFSCLCSEYSSGGYSVGEFAYLCLNLYCALPSTDQSIKAYEVCSAQASPVKPTHNIITPPATISIVTDPMTTPISTGTIMSSPPVMVTTAAGPMSQSPLPSAMPRSDNPSSLTKTQAVGISVAAMGSVIVGILIIYMVIWIRHRKATKFKAADMDKPDDSNKYIQLNRHRYGWPYAPGNSQVSGASAVQPFMGEKLEDWPSKPLSVHVAEYYKPRDRLAPPRPEPRASSSCYSVSSTGAASQLLPEPLNTSRTLPKSIAPVSSPATISGETLSPHKFVPLPKIMTRPPSEFPHPAFAPKPLPPCPVLDPGEESPLTRGNSRRVLPDFRASRPVNNCFTCEPISRTGSSKTIDSLIGFYQGFEHPETFYTQPSRLSRQTSLPRSAPRPLKSSLRRKNRRPSPISGVSFESTNTGGAAPQELQRLLPPVVEMSSISSINQIQYPRVPQASNQVVPLSPRAERLLKNKNRIRSRYPVAVSPIQGGSPNSVTTDPRQQLPSFSTIAPLRITPRPRIVSPPLVSSPASLRTSSSSDTKVDSSVQEAGQDFKSSDID